jgi:hypothetical protein
MTINRTRNFEERHWLFGLGIVSIAEGVVTTFTGGRYTTDFRLEWMLLDEEQTTTYWKSTRLAFQILRGIRPSEAVSNDSRFDQGE